MYVREIGPDETALAGPAMLHLRPHLGDVAGFTARADAQRAAGYRVAGSFAPDRDDAVAVASFRVTDSLA